LAKFIESRSIDYVPRAERHGKVWHLWPVWFTGDAHMATLATGVIGGALGLNLLWSAIAIITGCGLGTFFMAFHSTQGPQLGLPQMIQSRPQFGTKGVLLVWLVALVTYVGYSAFNQVLAGQVAQQLLGADQKTAFSLFTLVAIGIAVVGYDLIHKAQRFLAYVMMAALLAFSVGAALLLTLPDGQIAWSGFSWIPFLTQFFAAAAYQLSWSIYVSDYSRYLPADVGVRSSFWWTYLGAMIGGVWMMLVGAVAAALDAKLDVVLAVRQAGDAVYPGLGSVLLVMAFITMLTATALNFYGGSLTLLAVADTVKPLKCTPPKRIASLIAVGVLATAIAWQASDDFMSSFSDLLAVLLYLFTPWTAVNLVDFYMVRKGHYSVREIFNPNGMYRGWNWRGLSAYGVGFAAMVPFFSTGLYTGPVAHMLGGADIAMVIGLPVAAGAYLLACRSMDLEGDRRTAEMADVGLEEDSVAGDGAERMTVLEFGHG
jgi:NCS1 nucleoside transporter family